MEANIRAAVETAKGAGETAKLTKEVAERTVDAVTEAEGRSKIVTKRPEIAAKQLSQILDEIEVPFRAAAEVSRKGELLLRLLVSTRDRLREAKQWQLADEIRSKLGELGIALEDTPKGTVWKRKRG